MFSNYCCLLAVVSFTLWSIAVSHKSFERSNSNSGQRGFGLGNRVGSNPILKTGPFGKGLFGHGTRNSKTDSSHQSFGNHHQKQHGNAHQNTIASVNVNDDAVTVVNGANVMQDQRHGNLQQGNQHNRPEHNVHHEHIVRPEHKSPPQHNTHLEHTNPHQRNTHPELTNPPKHNYRPEHTNAPQHEKRPEPANPPQHNNRPEDTNPPKHNNRPAHTNPPKHNNRPEHTNPPKHNNRPEHTNPPKHNNRPEHTNPPQHNNRPEHTNLPKHNDRHERTNPPKNSKSPEHNNRQNGRNIITPSNSNSIADPVTPLNSGVTVASVSGSGSNTQNRKNEADRSKKEPKAAMPDPNTISVVPVDLTPNKMVQNSVSDKSHINFPDDTARPEINNNRKNGQGNNGKENNNSPSKTDSNNNPVARVNSEATPASVSGSGSGFQDHIDQADRSNKRPNGRGNSAATPDPDSNRVAPVDPTPNANWLKHSANDQSQNGQGGVKRNGSGEKDRQHTDSPMNRLPTAPPNIQTNSDAVNPVVAVNDATDGNTAAS